MTRPSARRDYATAWLATLLFYIAFYALLVPLPLYLTRIGLPDWQVGVILGAFGVTSLITRPLAGAFADAWGRRTMMLLGAGALMVGIVGVGMTAQPLVLLGMRMFQAAGYVAFTTAATALVSDLAPPPERGAALARFGVAANIAMTLTPAAVGAGLHALTLRGALWVAGALAAISGLVSLRMPTAAPVEPAHSEPRPLVHAPGTLRIPMAAAGLFGVGYGAFLQFLPLLSDRRRVGPAGLAYAAYGIGIILTRLATGRLLDRGERARMLIPAFLLLAAGLCGFAFTGSRGTLLWAAVLVAVGSGILHPALIAIHVERMPADERGRAAGWFYLGFDLGIGLGVWALSPVFQWLGLTGLYLLAAAAAGAGVLLVPFLRLGARQGMPA